MEQLRCAAFQGLLKAEPEQAVSRWTAGLADGGSRGGGVAWQRFVAQLVCQQADDAQIESLCNTKTLSQIPAAGQTCLLDALHARRHPALREAALAAIATNDPPLRLAALRVLATSGEAADVPLLAKLAAEADPAVQELAEQSLAQLQAPGVDDAILKLLDVPEARQCVAAIRTLVARHSPGTGAGHGTWTQDSSSWHKASRRWFAWRRSRHCRQLPMLPWPMRSSRSWPTRPRARSGMRRSARWQNAVRRLCRPTGQAEAVLTALTRANAQQRAALLPALGRIGGSQALQVIQQAMQDPDGGVRDAAIRGLCNWPDATVADQLLELARAGERDTHRIWALRGYARVIVLNGKAAPSEVTAGLREALKLATRLEDKQLILSRLTAVRCVESLSLGCVPAG